MTQEIIDLVEQAKQGSQKHLVNYTISIKLIFGILLWV